MSCHFQIKTADLFLIVSVIIYLVISLKLFDFLYLTTKVVIDEEFHLPLGESYCKFNYSKWDPKVTTPPGLYLLSSVILGPLELCSIYWLRFISFGASIINLVLFYVLFVEYNGEKSFKNVLSAVNLALLPPLYFFSHLYYTDVVSLTTILLMLLFSNKHYHYVASLFGMFSIFFRQTNIIWVGLILANLIITQLHINLKKSNASPTERKSITISDVIDVICNIKICLQMIFKRMPLQFFLDCCGYFTVVFCFLLFIFLNGSIVVGDKTAHEATVHIPQLFYFSLFALIFSWPYFIKEVPYFIAFIKKHKFLVIIAIFFGVVIIYLNTLVHPYILADNRHYGFYIWNRFYGKYTSFRYIMILPYIFAVCIIFKTIWNQNDVRFGLLYILCVLIVLCSQKLIEVRYYFVPYILFRLHVKNISTLEVIAEFTTYIVINIATFNIFFNQKIYWENFEEPQRIIW